MSEKASKNHLQGRTISPRPLTGKESLSELIQHAFTAYNAGRLREACELLTRKVLQPDVTVGLSLSGAPLGAWIAVRGDVAPAPFLLAAAVLLWTAGFDILYALQDLDFDRKEGLFSIPVRFGVPGSLWLSGALHTGMLVLLALLPQVYSSAAPAGKLGGWYWLGWAGCVVLLAYQHWVVRPNDLRRLDAAFFQANGLLSLWLFAWTALAILRP